MPFFWRRPNINELAEDRNAILLDVREADEYREGHIPGALNYPLSALESLDLPWNKDAAIHVYCLTGARSGRAVRLLQARGYSNVKNIGGINAYRGSLER